jgi:hypothetical protein
MSLKHQYKQMIASVRVLQVIPIAASLKTLLVRTDCEQGTEYYCSQWMSIHKQTNTWSNLKSIRHLHAPLSTIIPFYSWTSCVSAWWGIVLVYRPHLRWCVHRSSRWSCKQRNLDFYCSTHQLVWFLPWSLQLWYVWGHSDCHSRLVAEMMAVKLGFENNGYLTVTVQAMILPQRLQSTCCIWLRVWWGDQV